MNHNFRKLLIWQESLELVSETYEITKKFPQDERFNLISQLNRCSVSIPSNIAEGTSKNTVKHFRVYLETTIGSAFEWETQIIIAKRLNYINQEKFNHLENKIKRLQNMIYKFANSL
jgi:four helix bundle protein